MKRRDEQGARRWISEAGGAFGDMGTFVPHVLGAIKVAGLAPGGILVGFGAFYVVTGLVYRIPVAVQPMKAVSAVLLTSGLSAREVAAAGLLLGAILVALAASGAVDRLARVVPQSVTTGLQLGLGVTLGWLAIGLIASTWWLGVAMALALLALARVPGCPATLVALAGAIFTGHALGLAGPVPALVPALDLPHPVLPATGDAARAFTAAVLPQIALTVTNAVIVTAALARDLYGERARRATPRNLALTSGVANLALAPLGALPMCHGAGGLAAQHRFGARTGTAPVLIGVLLLGLGLAFADAAGALLALVPAAAVGALLLLSAVELAWSRRLVDARRSCYPVIGITAAATVLADPLWGLAAGWAVEAGAAGAAVALRRWRGT